MSTITIYIEAETNDIDLEDFIWYLENVFVIIFQNIITKSMPKYAKLGFQTKNTL